MGYINIPKLIQGGGGDEPTIYTRNMPDDWKYYTSLKLSNKDQAYLLFTGGSGVFALETVEAPSEIYLYGGQDGRQPLYKCVYTTASTNRRWYRWDTTESDWVATPRVTMSGTINSKLIDLEKYPYPFALRLWDLTGKQVTNDINIGTCQLITMIVHKTDDAYPQTTINETTGYGGGANSSGGEVPLVAYSGPTLGLSKSLAAMHKLEFVEFTYNNGFNNYELSNSYSLNKIDLSAYTQLSSYMLNYNIGLQEAILNNSLTEIPGYCFQGCENLIKINCPSSLTTIKTYAFDGCSKLRKFDFPSTVTTIESWAFNGCANLAEATIPSSTTSLSDNVFRDCTNLEKITLHNNITTIGETAFYDCKSLRSITLPTNLTSIGMNAFMNCSNLKEIAIPSTTQIGVGAFKGCTSLTSVILPTNLQSITNELFSGCNMLEKVQIPSTVEGISSYAFYQCYSLEEIILPNNLTTIGDHAFSYCKNLVKLEIPSTVTSIDANAFSSCGSLVYYRLKGVPPTIANVNVFSGPNSYSKFLVPYDYISNYRTATNWSSATNNIKYKIKGYKTFNSGDVFPSTDSTGNYTLKWYELATILNTAASATPTSGQLTEAPYTGEFYCTITG